MLSVIDGNRPSAARMTEPLTERTVVIGNNGPGKSTLAEAVADLAHIPAIDLDAMHWEEGRYGLERNEDVARKMVLDISGQPRWIIEGVFGWLADVVLPRATALIWLDLPWSACRARPLARGPRRGATNHDAAELMTWAQAIGRGRHHRPLRAIPMFNDFSGTKLRLESREQVDWFLERLRANIK